MALMALMARAREAIGHRDTMQKSESQFNCEEMSRTCCSIDYTLLDTYRQRVEMLNHTLKPIVLPSYCGKQGLEDKQTGRKEELQSQQQASERCAAHLIVSCMYAKESNHALL